MKASAPLQKAMAKKRAKKSPKSKTSTDDELLNLQLEAIYTVLSTAGLLGAMDGMPTTHFAETALPELVLHIAVVTSLVPEPPSGDVGFGDYLVPAKYRDDLLKRLANGISELRTHIASWGRFREPNPVTTIKRFCTLNHLHHSTTFIKRLLSEKCSGS
jgi:hypothetical protein